MAFHFMRFISQFPNFYIQPSFCLIHSLRIDELYATINTTYIERRVFQMTASIRLRFHLIN